MRQFRLGLDSSASGAMGAVGASSLGAAPRGSAALGLGQRLISGAEAGAAPYGWALATIAYGAEPPLPESGLGLGVPLTWLGGGGDLEVWETSVRPSSGRHGDLAFAVAGPVLFAAVELPAAGGQELEGAARYAYQALLSTAREAGCPHPLRFWNVLPAINESQEGLERYRRFCRARAEALEEHFGPDFCRELCASSAVGSASGPLLVYMLAGAEPGRQRENPRQVSAFSYPPVYGPRSPSFARATRCPETLGGALLLSGTASIVGHRTVHAECVGCQLEETLRNLRSLIVPSASARDGGSAAFQSLKVYLRHSEHLAQVRHRLEQEVGADFPVLYLQADICRRELLLEIEGIAG